MRTSQDSDHSLRRRAFLLVVPLVLILTFLFAACGTSGGTGSGSGSTPTTVPTTGTAEGCPSNASVTTPPSMANITLKPADSHSTVTAHTGNVIEIDLPFGQKWSGPTTSQGELQLQTPYGYASQAKKACIWRFIAQAPGTTQLQFLGRAICKPGQVCPQYILSVPFTIVVK